MARKRKSVKKAITARQKSARRKNMAIARAAKKRAPHKKKMAEYMESMKKRRKGSGAYKAAKSMYLFHKKESRDILRSVDWARL